MQMLHCSTFFCHQLCLAPPTVQLMKLPLCLCYRAVIGEIDEETDSALDLGNIRAEPLNSIVH